VPRCAVQRAEQNTHRRTDMIQCCAVLCCAVLCPQFHGGECPYNSEGLLMNTHVTGVMECPKNCKKTNLCKVSSSTHTEFRACAPA
jgi:hypothetical protein